MQGSDFVETIVNVYMVNSNGYPICFLRRHAKFVQLAPRYVHKYAGTNNDRAASPLALSSPAHPSFLVHGLPIQI